MPELRKTWLRDIVYNRVDLVDAGANTAAHIKLFKRREDANMPKTLEEIIAKMQPEHAAIVNDAIAKAKAEVPVDTVTKLSAAEQAVIDEKAKTAALTDEVAKLQKEAPKDEDVLKNLDPAVRAIVEKSQLQAAAAEEMVRKMKDTQDDNEAVIKAAEIPNIPGAGEGGLAPILKGLKAKDAGLFDQVFGIFKATDALLADSDAMKEIGKKGTKGEGTDEAAAWAAIEKAAETVAVAKSITKAAAIARVMQDQPELYQTYIDAQTGAK